MLLTACSGVNDLGLDAPPMFVLKGRVEDGALVRAKGASLHAALVWARKPSIDLVCLQYSDRPEILSACRDPYAFVPGRIEQPVPLMRDAAGNFDVTVWSLPPASVGVGDTAGRVSYGSLFVFEDTNGNGTFEQSPGAFRRGDDRPGPAPEEPPRGDRAVAASFITMLLPQQRIVFREGAWDAGSYFYPPLGCAVPVPGFSLMNAALKLGGETLEGTCTLSGTDARVSLLPISDLTAPPFECPATSSRILDPREEESSDDPDAPPTDGSGICLSKDLLVRIDGEACPSMRVWPLKGCRGNLLCPDPDWDLAKSPPEWWPCP